MLKPLRFSLLFVLALATPVFPASAQDVGDAALYQVSDVIVDITAENAAQARDQAIVRAQHQALAQLLERLGADPALEQHVGDDALAAMVLAFEMQQERLSAVRYIGTFTVRFKPAAVRLFLEKQGSAFAEIASTPAVVLPVVNTGARAVLWEERTPWRSAWESAVGKGGLVPVIVPQGSLDDIAMISAVEAISGKTEALLALMARYRAPMAVVAVLNFDPDNIDPNRPVKIDLQRVDSSEKIYELAPVDLPPVADARALGNALASGVRKARAALEASLRTGATSAPVSGEQISYLRVAVPLDSLESWNRIKNTLSVIASVKGARILSLTRHRADIEMQFLGGIPQLQPALAEHGLYLELAHDASGWLLKERKGGFE